MPARRKHGGSRGGAGKQEKDMADSHTTSGEEDAATDNFAEDKSSSEIEMSVDLDKTQENKLGARDTDTGKQEGDHLELMGTENKEKEPEKKGAGKKDESMEKDRKTAEKGKGADNKAKEKKSQSTDSNADDSTEKINQRTGLLETPESRHLESIDMRCVKVEPIPSFEVKEMRSRWKWSISISPVRPEDIMVSDLMTMPRVQESYFHLPKSPNGNGQMELCTKTTNDTLLVMLRVLRSEFVNRIITVEVTKRAYLKPAKQSAEPSTEDSSAVSETKPVQESAKGCSGAEATAVSESEEKEKDKKEADNMEQRRREDLEEAEDEDGNSVVWGELKEKATFVVNLNRVQKINFRLKKKFKGDLARRSVYVGSLLKHTTEEIMKVIFPIANSIVMKPADDPNMRHVFIETSHRANCIGFVTSYLGLNINGHDLKLSIRQQDLDLLQVQGDKEKKEEKKKDGADEEKNNEEDNKTEGADKVEGEEKEGKTEQTEKTEEDKVDAEKRDKEKKEGKGPGRELTEEERKLRAQQNRLKKKRKREFIEEVAREWTSKRLRPDPDMPGPMLMGMGPRFPGFGPPKGRGGMFPFGRGGIMGVPLAPPMIHIQEKVAGLLRLQNQLEKTISTQMEFLHHSDAAARQQAEIIRMREMAIMNQDMGFYGPGDSMGKGMRGRGGKFQRGGASPRGGKGDGDGGMDRNFGGKEGKQREFSSPSNEGESGGGFGNKRFRRDSDSRYDNRGGDQEDDFKGGKGFQRGNQGNFRGGQKKFGQGEKEFGGGNNSSFGGGSFGGGGANFGDKSFGGGGNFGGGRNKFGRGGKFGGGGNQGGGGKFGGGGNQGGGGKFGSPKAGGSGSFGGNANQMGSTNFGGGGSMLSPGGGNKVGGGRDFGGSVNSFGSSGMSTSSNFGGGGGMNSGNNFGGSAMNTGSNFGGMGLNTGTSFGGSTMNSGGSGMMNQGGNFGGSGMITGSAFGGGSMNTGGANFGGNNWNTGMNTSTSMGNQNYGQGNFGGGGNFGSGMIPGSFSGSSTTTGNFGSAGSAGMMGASNIGSDSMSSNYNMCGSYGSTDSYSTTGFGQQQHQSWNYGQNQAGGQQQW